MFLLLSFEKFKIKHEKYDTNDILFFDFSLTFTIWGKLIFGD